jgi:putative transcriptional regulator
MTDPQAAGTKPAPTHHPSAETLASYAAGTMRPGFDVVIAAHLRACARCRREAAKLEGLGGILVSEIDPVALSEESLAATLARLDEPSFSPSSPVDGLGQLLSRARRRWVAPGVWTAKVDTPRHRDDRVFLLRTAPGAKTARHTHAGAEFTQVLEGALDDGGTIYRAGDFVELDADHIHHPKVHGDEPCLCLFATEGRLVPTNWIGRLAFAIAGV